MNDRLAVGLLDRKRGAAAFHVGGLDRVGQPRAEIAVDFQSVDDHLERRLILQRRRVHVLELHGVAIDEQPAEPLPPQGRQHLGDRIDEARQGRLRHAILISARRVGALFLLGVALARERRGGHERHLEPDEQTRARCELAELASHDFGGLACNVAPAAPANCSPDSCEQQAEIIVNLGGRPDSGSGVADAVLLTDGDCWTDAFDGVDVWFFHPLEELPGIGRQRFDVPPLAFGVNRIEGQRRLAGTADPRHHHERTWRDGDVDVLQVVSARPANDNLAAGLGGGWHCLLCALPAKAEQSMVAQLPQALQPRRPKSPDAFLAVRAILMGLSATLAAGSPVGSSVDATKRGLCQFVCSLATCLTRQRRQSCAITCQVSENPPR